jgi:hypothetical protein
VHRTPRSAITPNMFASRATRNHLALARRRSAAGVASRQPAQCTPERDAGASTVRAQRHDIAHRVTDVKCTENASLRAARRRF